MKVKAQITFRKLNPEYDKEYAEQYYNGQESPDNNKYKKDWTLGINGDVKEISVKKNETIQLMDCDVSGLTIIEYKIDGEKTVTFGISTSLITNILKTGKPKYDTSHVYIYLKDTDDYYRVGDSLLIACADFPEALMKYIVHN